MIFNWKSGTWITGGANLLRSFSGNLRGAKFGGHSRLSGDYSESNRTNRNQWTRLVTTADQKPRKSIWTYQSLLNTYNISCALLSYYGWWTTSLRVFVVFSWPDFSLTNFFFRVAFVLDQPSSWPTFSRPTVFLDQLLFSTNLFSRPIVFLDRLLFLTNFFLDQLFFSTNFSPRPTFFSDQRFSRPTIFSTNLFSR